MTPPTALPTLRLVPGFADLNAQVQPSDGPDTELLRWQELLAQAGREQAEPLTAALERLSAVTTTGRLDRAGLNALVQEIDRARQAGIWCQQIARLASGRVRQSHERVHLTNTVQSVLAHRARELQSRGIHIAQSLQTVEVQIDASMLHGLLNALTEWWLGCAQGVIDVRIDVDPHTAQGRLSCQFQSRHAEVSRMGWHLLEQTARTLGVVYEREMDHAQTRLTLAFVRTLNPQASPPLNDHPDIGFAESINSKPLAGCHVLVVAPQRHLRLQVRESIQSMGLVIDFASAVVDAAEFCRECLPHGIVFDASLKTPKFEQLVCSIRQEIPDFVFIELTNDTLAFEMSSLSPSGMARVGRHAMASALPSALVYELTRIM